MQKVDYSDLQVILQQIFSSKYAKLIWRKSFYAFAIFSYDVGRPSQTLNQAEFYNSGALQFDNASCEI